MQLKADVLELIQLYNAQYAGAYVGDPETTYDKILQRCNHNLQMVANHFAYVDDFHDISYVKAESIAEFVEKHSNKEASDDKRNKSF